MTPDEVISRYMMKVLVDQSCLILCDPMDCSPPGSSVHGISQKEYWSGLPFHSPENFPDPGIEPGSPTLQADSLPSEPPGKSSLHQGIPRNWRWGHRLLALTRH